MIADLPKLTQPEAYQTFVFPAVNDEDIGCEGPMGQVKAVGESPQINRPVIGYARNALERLRSIVGRSLYRSLYEGFVPIAVSALEGPDNNGETAFTWWWENPAIVSECREYGSTFSLLAYKCQNGV